MIARDEDPKSDDQVEIEHVLRARQIELWNDSDELKAVVEATPDGLRAMLLEGDEPQESVVIGRNNGAIVVQIYNSAGICRGEAVLGQPSYVNFYDESGSHKSTFLSNVPASVLKFMQMGATE